MRVVYARHQYSSRRRCHSKLFARSLLQRRAGNLVSIWLSWPFSDWRDYSCVCASAGRSPIEFGNSLSDHVDAGCSLHLSSLRVLFWRRHVERHPRRKSASAFADVRVRRPVLWNDLPALHDGRDVFQHPDIAERIALDRNHVREEPRRHAADLVLPADQFGG